MPTMTLPSSNVSINHINSLSNLVLSITLALPSGKSGDVTGILCNFDEFGNSMGMYINSTAVMCVTPHIQGHPEDYGRETVQLTVAMNGQDFNDIDSDAYVTFVGTGSNGGWKILIFILLLALLIAACFGFFLTWSQGGPKKEMPAQHVFNDDPTVLQPRDTGGRTLPKGYNQGVQLSSSRQSYRK